MLFYSGAALPATPDAAPTVGNVLLGSVPLATPSGSITTEGDLATWTFTTPVSSPALATGVIGWMRLADGTGAGVLDLPVVKFPATGPVAVTDTQVYAGGDIQLMSCVISE
jgi:hypothetical protein